ncbi:C40 family peptidase [Neisseria leonii]|uniref:C40 family peptidase n=1 Tax=Neisseria leonii TaxID=2995413 RepID=A0A9X4I9W3_9NEIS|nr:C40 family peptidase [Neisseria sp. 51.81]MDD9326754.1 C40 family peptidase [Neisseria sp. 51.81]
MMKLTKAVRTAIEKHAKAAAPNESCGLILMKGRRQAYLPCGNTAADPAETFEIAPEAWIAAEADGAEVVAVAHSHPNGEPFLSGADRQSQRAVGLPYVLYTGGVFKVFRPCPHLRGRQFVYGKTDCAALVRDLYMLAGIDAPDHERTQIDDDAADGRLMAHLIACGLTQIGRNRTLKAGDILLTSYGSDANHAAVYLGDGHIIHHEYNRLSRREPYTEMWQLRTHSVWRHPQWDEGCIEAVHADLNFMEGIS